MLRTLRINHYAIVDQLEIDFSAGMSVLSGETGAGKSILLGALGLTLGDRADSSVVAPGAKRAEISVTYELQQLPVVQAWLSERELDTDETLCIIRRTISSDGRSRAFINGQPVPLQTIKELGEQLVEIQGQHAHQGLLRREVQRQLLDQYGDHLALVTQVAHSFRQLLQTQQRLQLLSQANQQQQDRYNLLQFQIGELEQLDLRSGELDQLEETQRRLSHATTILEGVQGAMELLDGDQPATLIPMLERMGSTLQQQQQHDPALRNSCELIDGATIQLQEAYSELRRYIDQIEVDPQQLQQVEQRLSEVLTMARKYRIQPEALTEQLEALLQEQQQISEASAEIPRLESELQQLQSQYQQLSQQLSQQRHTAAEQLSFAVTQNIHQLGMGDGLLRIALTPNESGPGPFGMEQVELMIRTNPGQPERPLNKIASGGELSRVSLAIQVVSANKNSIPTMIFDEVDVGIGGETAEMVGQQLRQLGGRCQVLCVTHQPQVAAQGHHHFRIQKQSDGTTTRTVVTQLTQEQRIYEVARMSAGVEISAPTLSHAAEMIARAQQVG